MIPPSARALASPSLAQQKPTAPAASCSLAMSTLLWVLAWGRSLIPFSAAKLAMRAMLRSRAARSITSTGVLSASREPGTPIRAAWRSWSFIVALPLEAEKLGQVSVGELGRRIPGLAHPQEIADARIEAMDIGVG